MMLRQCLSVLALMAVAACGMNGNYRDTDVKMESVSQLDIARYDGLWYEIARFPNGFEENCFAVTAEYSRRADGRITVTNSCLKGGFDGPLEVAEGVARIAAPGQLKVKFVEWLPFEGDYWVIGLDEDYDWAVVGEPAGDFGWILARSAMPPSADIDAALAVLKGAGYDTNRLYFTQHPESR